MENADSAVLVPVFREPGAGVAPWRQIVWSLDCYQRAALSVGGVVGVLYRNDLG